MMRTLALLLLISVAAQAETETKATLDTKAVRLIDDQNRIYNFHEFKSVHLFAPNESDAGKIYQKIKKRFDAAKKDKKVAPLKGNPASSLCSEQLKGKNRTLKDLIGNEYAICEFEDGSMVDAWDVFRLKK
jgi:putative hemolysin